MNLNKRTKSSLFLFCLLLILSSAFLSASAKECAPEWTVDLVKQLMGEDGQNLPEKANTTAVGYALRFSQLRRDEWALLSLGLELDTDRQGPGMWLLSVENPVLDLFFDSEFHLLPSLRAELGRWEKGAEYDSWMITTVGEPLLIEISSTQIAAAPLEQAGESLKIMLSPQYVEPETQRVKSEINFSYRGSGGDTVDLQTSVLADASPQRPIAVVSKGSKGVQRSEQQYFAIYLAALEISSELLPCEGGYLPAGSISGLQLFMEKSGGSPAAEFEAAACFQGASKGLFLGASLPLGKNLRVYGSLGTLPVLAFVFGMEGGISDELCLVSEFESGEKSEPALRLGLRDELNWGPYCKISATVLPLQLALLDLAGKPIFGGWRFRFEQALNSCGIWYEFKTDRFQTRMHQAGIYTSRSNSVGTKISWSWDQQNKASFAAGMLFRF